ERRFPSVLIAGTNGKGSTAATLASILKASGLRTGLYTSPHLIRINERIRINGEEISDDEFALLHDMIDRTAERLVGESEWPWHRGHASTTAAGQWRNWEHDPRFGGTGCECRPLCAASRAKHPVPRRQQRVRACNFPLSARSHGETNISRDSPGRAPSA